MTVLSFIWQVCTICWFAWGLLARRDVKEKLNIRDVAEILGLAIIFSIPLTIIMMIDNIIEFTKKKNKFEKTK